jgi:hypothetical protein
MDSLSATVARLQAFGSRNATKSGGRLAAGWIEARFHSYGIADVEIWDWNSMYAGNVVATIPGTVTPDQIYVLGAHYDSINPDSNVEPGADDNASGTAAVLECARVMARSQFRSTIRFITFGAEEWGLLGSEAYASDCARRSEYITGMVNLDMVGYLDPGDTRDLNAIWNPASAWLGEEAQSAAVRFIPDLPLHRVKLMQGSSDHESFWRHGYSAILIHEDVAHQSPYKHTAQDIVGVSYNDPALETYATRLAAAIVATLAGEPETPVLVQSFAARTTGDGVELHWEYAREAGRELRGTEVQRAGRSAGPFATCSPILVSTRGAGFFVDVTVQRGERYWYRLALHGQFGTTSFSAPVGVTAGARVAQIALLPIANGPAGQPVAIRYRIGPDAAAVQISLFDVRGRHLRTLVTGRREPGEHLVSWDRCDAGGVTAGHGVYFVRLQAGGATDVQKLVLDRR